MAATIATAAPVSAAKPWYKVLYVQVLIAIVLGALLKGVRKKSRVEIPGSRIAVQKHGLCAQIAHRIDAGHERSSRTEYLVSRADPQ